MSMARRPSPFGELLSLRQAMDRLFEDSYLRSRGEPYGNVEAMALPLDIYGTPDAVVVEAALPGVRPEDVDITVFGNTLTITGTSFDQRSTEEPDYIYQELRRGTYSRTVALPNNLDTHASTATFDHGMLRLSIPKAPEAKPRQIRITPSFEGAGAGSFQQDQTSIGDDSWAGGDAAWTAGTVQGTQAWSGDAGATEGTDSWAGGTEAAGAWTDTGTDPATAWTEQSPGADTWAVSGTEQWGAAGDGTWGQPADGEGPTATDGVEAQAEMVEPAADPQPEAEPSTPSGSRDGTAGR